MKSAFVVLMLLLFVLPVLYGLQPATFSVRLEKLADKFDTYDLSFPQFPEFNSEYVNDGGNVVTRAVRSVLESLRLIGTIILWIGKVLWWFCKDVAIAIEGFSILVFNY